MPLLLLFFLEVTTSKVAKVTRYDKINWPSLTLKTWQPAILAVISNNVHQITLPGSSSRSSACFRRILAPGSKIFIMLFLKREDVSIIYCVRLSVGLSIRDSVYRSTALLMLTILVFDLFTKNVKIVQHLSV